MNPNAIRALCTQLGLDAVLIDGVSASKILVACIEVESNFNAHAIHFNQNQAGAVTSIDYGICQINDYWNIGPGKPFVSPEQVLTYPYECVTWMIHMFKAGKQNLWSSYTSGAYKKFLTA